MGAPPSALIGKTAYCDAVQLAGPASVASWSSTANAAWNKQAEVPLEQWLLHEKPSLPDSRRLHTLGNIVIPQCAELAMQIIASMPGWPAAAV